MSKSSVRATRTGVFSSGATVCQAAKPHVDSFAAYPQMFREPCIGGVGRHTLEKGR
jgi:hypothetical protein